MEIPDIPIPSPYSIQHRLLQTLEQQRTDGEIVPPTQGSKGFQELFFQTEWAMRQLRAACHLYETSPFPARRVLLPVLIPAAILLFKIRDQGAFEQISQLPAYPDWGLSAKLRQLPTWDQLNALLGAQPEAAKQALEILQPLSDTALGLTDFRQFRDRLVQQELPLEDPADTTSPFPHAPVDYLALTQAALSGWGRLKQILP